jgi:hypothetical protein
MRKIKTFESFEKDTDTGGLSRQYLFETCNIQEVLDMLLRVAYEIYENPKSDFEEEEDGQLLLIVNISFGGGNFASTQFDTKILRNMSVGFEDLAWQFEEPVDNEFFERNQNGDIEMGMDIGVVYNVGGWDPTLLDEDTSNACGLISDNLPEWNIDTVNGWDL